MASVRVAVFFVLVHFSLSSAILWAETKPMQGDIKSDKCEENCFYHKWNETFSCNRKACSAIPDEIPPTTKTIILELNNIKEVNVLDFESLENIDLSSNKIENVQPGAFRKCKNIRRIDLSLNNIKEITNRTFESNAFDSQLQTLDLSYNKIEELAHDLFHADLRKSLEVLDLSDNFIKKIGDSTFKELYRLKKLVLSSNNITEILPKHFKGMFALGELDLNDNNIETILDRTFDELDYLTTLDLKFNQIYVIETDAFKGLDQLEDLILSHNQITTLDPGVFTPLVSLTDLHLDFNPIMTIYPQTFPSSLVYLSMVKMPNLQEIHPRTFANCHSLNTVHLGENSQLHNIAADAFRGKNSSVRQLNIKNNALTAISEDLLQWDRVTDIDLRGNKWNCDCEMKWIKRAKIPSRNKDEIRCASPPVLAHHSVVSLPESVFTCSEIIPNKSAFRTGMIAVTTFAFFFILFVFLYKCRYRVLPCWFAKPGKYFALYNVKDVDDNQMVTNGYTSQGVIKHRNGAPAPVHV